MPAQDDAPTKLTDRLLQRLPWLDGVSDSVQQMLDPLVGAKSPTLVRDLLNGVPIGHPLHPVVVVLPLGAWTSTLILDVAGLDAGADLCLGVGLLGAVGAAASGAAQWQWTQGKPRRLGMAHAGLNTAATALYAVSWLRRARGARRTGITFSTLGYALGATSAWLGGELAYDLGIGINRTAFEQAPTEWTEVARLEAVPEHALTRVDLGGVPVVLVRDGEQVHAIAATCTHLGGPLDEGQLDGDVVRCPWHGSEFCMSDGTVVHGPATAPQPTYEVEVTDGRVLLRAATLR